MSCKIIENQKGQNLIEVLVALAIFFIFISGSLILSFRYLDTFSKARELKEVQYIAAEGFEALQSIAYNNWASLIGGSYGLNSLAGTWQLQADPDVTKNKYTRTISIASVERDEDCEIVGSGKISYYYSQTRDMFLEDEMRAAGADIYCKDNCGPNNTDAFLDNIINYDVVVMEDPHFDKGGTYSNTQKQTIIENYVSAGGNIFLTEHIKIDMLNVEFTSNGDNPATVIATDPYFAFNISETVIFIQKPSIHNLGAQNFVELMRYSNDEIAMASWTFGNGLVYFISDIDTQYLGGTIEQVITDGILALSPGGSGIPQEDPDTKLITVTINWQNQQRSFNQTFNSYLTAWDNPTSCLEEGEAADLVIDVSMARIDTTKKSLVGVVLRNIGTIPITLDKMTLTWTEPGNILFIKIEGTNHWHHSSGVGSPQGAQPSGTELDLVDLILETEEDYEVDIFRFNAKVDGSTFTITAIMSDGTSTTELTTPPFIP